MENEGRMTALQAARQLCISMIRIKQLATTGQVFYCRIEKTESDETFLEGKASCALQKQDSKEITGESIVQLTIHNR